LQLKFTMKKTQSSTESIIDKLIKIISNQYSLQVQQHQNGYIKSFAVRQSVMVYTLKIV
jgi:hypothetical protein